MSELFVIDNRPDRDESFGAVPRLKTLQDIVEHFAPITIHRNLGWEATPAGEACWKLVGFHVTVGIREITPLVWKADGSYLPDKKVCWYYTGAPARDDVQPAYYPKAFWGMTKGHPDSNGAHFTVSGDHNVAPGASGPDWVWVAAEPGGVQFSDAVSGLGMRVNTNHLIVSPVFQHVVKTAGGPAEDRPVVQPRPAQPAPAPRPSPQPVPQPGLGLRTCKVGVHGRNAGTFGDLDYEVIRRANLEVVKMMSLTDPAVFKTIKDKFPHVELITRLHHHDINAGGHPEPHKFVEDMVPIIDRLKAYCTKFQVTNEPNHIARYEGWGKEDEDARSFNAWFIAVYRALKNRFPDLSFGFPGLAVPDFLHRDKAWLRLCAEAIGEADWLGVHCYWQTPPGRASNNLDGNFGLCFKYYHEMYPGKPLEILECGNSNVQTPGFPLDEQMVAHEYEQWLQEVFKYSYINSASFFILSSPDVQNWSYFSWRTEDGRIKAVVDRLGQMQRPPLKATTAPLPPIVSKPKAGLTNQSVITAFRLAANNMGLDNWALMNKAGVKLADLVRDRQGPYVGPDINSLGRLTDAERAAIMNELQVLDAVSFDLSDADQPDFLCHRTDLQQTPLAPPPELQIMSAAGQNSAETRVINIWNRYGWLLLTIADQFELDPGVVAAVLAIESGGRGFSGDQRMIIRFENHIFFDRWGKYYPDRFQQYFSFDTTRRWQKHEWRPSLSAPWQEFHGAQGREWQVFEFARKLDETAAMLSISMGLPQVMGFNFATLGYEAVGDMFAAFSQDERNHLLGFFDFVCGPKAHSRRLPALRAREFDDFAALYNGPGQAARYGSLLRAAFDTFQRVKPAL